MIPRLSVCVAMPAHNEDDAIGPFIRELQNEFRPLHELEIVVVDDNSKDLTGTVAEQNGAKVLRNSSNHGHGPSYTKALRLAIAGDFDIIVMTDGDGQCSAKDLSVLVQQAFQSQEIFLGRRTNRKEPLYRRLVSVLLAIWASSRAGKFILDANTPHRAFPRNLALKYLEFFQGNELVPNVTGTVLIAKYMNLNYHNVQHRDRLGEGGQGKTWGESRQKELPSKKFLTFVAKAIVEFSSKRIKL